MSVYQSQPNIKSKGDQLSKSTLKRKYSNTSRLKMHELSEKLGFKKINPFQMDLEHVDEEGIYALSEEKLKLQL